MRLFLLSMGLLAAAVLGSCDDKNQDSPLFNKRWGLVKIEDFYITLSSYSGTYNSYIEFDLSDKRTTGLGPCNTFNGTFTIGSKGKLTISPQSTTRISCPALGIEQAYLDALPRTVRYEISGQELRLYDATNSTKPLLVFESRD